MKSYFEATARQRARVLLDSFEEFENREVSPHLIEWGLPVSFDDGVIIGKGSIEGLDVLIASQEGKFMGGSVGEIHGAKIIGLLEKALIDKPRAVLLLFDTGGVRLHEANAGLIAVAKIVRGVLDVREAGIPVIVLIGGSSGCFGGMGIVASCASSVIMSEEGRLGMSGPEVIETAQGVEEFDSRDRALVWATTGGKWRYETGDCDRIVEDDIGQFRKAVVEAIREGKDVGLTLESIEKEQRELLERIRHA